MSEELFQNRYRIPSARAEWHDYNSGMYFVTICTQGMEHYFGEIIGNVRNCRDDVHIAGSKTEPTMILSKIGEFADEQFRNVRKHYPYAEIPLWVVMPNHIHCIAIIDDIMPEPMSDVNAVETMCTSSLQEHKRKLRWKRNIVDPNMQYVSMRPGKLSTTIGGLKRAVSRFANQNHIPFAWQPRFYDRIVRNNSEMNRISQYIEQNVTKWAYNINYDITPM